MLDLNRDGSGGVPMTGLTGVSAPWDPLQFKVEPLQSLGLVDLNPDREGLQIRMTIDISRSGVKEGDFIAYYKYISTQAIESAKAAGVEIRTLDGQLVSETSQAGWYDFTRRTVDGDGAEFVVRDGKIVAIDLILTDNAFGDVDFIVGRFADPGMPVAARDDRPPVISGPSGDAGAATSRKSVPENTTEVHRFTADEVVSWVLAGGADAARFNLDDSGRLSFKTAPDFELPTDAGRDNAYELLVRAVDALGNAAEQAVTVNVTDVLEAVPMYAVGLRSGDRLLTTDATKAKATAAAEGTSSGVDFWVMPNPGAGLVALKAWKNVLTGDLFYAPEGSALPYACYVEIDAGPLGYVPKAGQGAFDVQLWLNPQGITQVVGAASASQLSLSNKGYAAMSPLFASAAPLTTQAAQVELVGVVDMGPPGG